MFTERGGDCNIDHSYAFNGHLQYENDLKRLNWAPGDRRDLASRQSTLHTPAVRWDGNIIWCAHDAASEQISNLGAEALWMLDQCFRPPFHICSDRNREDRVSFHAIVRTTNQRTKCHENGGPKIAQISSQTSAFVFGLDLMSHYDAQEVLWVPCQQVLSLYIWCIHSLFQIANFVLVTWRDRLHHKHRWTI